jgi:hypothetical protein
MTENDSFAPVAGEAGFYPIDERLRANVRATIEAVFEEELASFLGRLRYDRATPRERLSPKAPRSSDHRHLRNGNGAVVNGGVKLGHGAAQNWATLGLRVRCAVGGGQSAALFM